MTLREVWCTVVKLRHVQAKCSTPGYHDLDMVIVQRLREILSNVEEPHDGR